MSDSLGLSRDRLPRIADWMDRYIEAEKIPGALTLVARHGEIAFLECRGLRDREAGHPVAEDTIFRVYSMTKPITAVALMMLFEEGRFRFEQPIADYLPEFAEMAVHVSGSGETMVTAVAKSPITIHHLMTHTAGLTYSFNDGPVAEAYGSQKVDFGPDAGPLAEVVTRLSRLPLVNQPGARWTYSVAMDVIGRLIEVISGQPLADYFRQRILDPLGMRETGFEVPAGQAGRFAALYGPGEAGGMKLLQGAAQNPYVTGVSTHSGGGGLVSTVGDYFRFAEFLRRKGELEGVRLLGRKTVEFMTVNHLSGDLASMGQSRFCETSFQGVGFGLGFWVLLDPAKAGVLTSPGEFGWGGAASTVFWVDPQEDLCVIFMTQLAPSDSYPLRPELRSLVYQALDD